MDLERVGRFAADVGRRCVALYWRVLDVVKEKGGNTVSGIIAFLITPIGRWAAISAMVLAAWFGFARHYERKGAASVTAAIEKKVTQNAQKANDVRRSVSKLPAGSLRDEYSRD